jgi:triphosphatase
MGAFQTKMTEFELKFTLDPAHAAAFRHSPALRAVRPTRRRLLNLYLDTPKAELARAQMALRLRRAGGHWFQTLKAGDSGAGGIHSRNEWEYARPGAHLDLSLFAGTPLGDIKDAAQLHERLATVFTVVFDRETWIVEVAPGSRISGSRIEVALDRGEVCVDGRRDAICEVELEVLEGENAAAFDLAHALLAGAALRPSTVTKAQRGWRLARNEGLVPAKAQRCVLEDSMSPRAAAHAAIAAGLAQLQANEEGLLASGDPEFVHQARVALRRIRSSFGLFRAALDPALGPFDDELRWIAGVLGTARDWDVLATTVLPGMIADHGDAHLARRLRALVAARRKRARASALAAIGSARYARLVLGLARGVAQPTPAREGEPPLADFASRILRKRHRKLLAHAKSIARFGAAQRHELRIDAKKLRYGVEGFASLFRDRRVDAYVQTLSDIQDDLGAANDAANAATMLGELPLPDAFRDFARGWLAAFTRAHTAGLEKHVSRLAGARRFWRKAPIAEV